MPQKEICVDFTMTQKGLNYHKNVSALDVIFSNKKHIVCVPYRFLSHGIFKFLFRYLNDKEATKCIKTKIASYVSRRQIYANIKILKDLEITLYKQLSK